MAIESPDNALYGSFQVSSYTSLRFSLCRTIFLVSLGLFLSSGCVAPTKEHQSGGTVLDKRVQIATEVSERSMSGEYRFYLGTLHAHSGYSGDHAKRIAKKFNHGVANYQMHTPAEVFQKARTNGYDFYFITDHSSPEQNAFYKGGFTEEHWAATKEQAMKATTANFVAMRGHEFSRNKDREHGGLGHMNVFNSSEWNSAYAPGHTFVWLYDWMLTQTNGMVVAQFNHPQMPGRPRVKNFNNYAGRTRERNRVVRLAEIWNSSGNLRYVPVVQKIWSLGWKVAPTAGTDVHGPFGIEKRMLRTGVLAEELTGEAILRALRDRRVYATLEPLLHLDFTLNGFEMGTALGRPPAGELKIRVYANDPGGSVLSRVEIHGGKYEAHGGAYALLTSVPLGRGRKRVETTVPRGQDFYYAVVYKEGLDSPRAFSAPIWMDDD